MLKYAIILSKTAQKQLNKLPNSIVDTLINSIQKLAEHPRPHGYKQLKGRDGYRIRKGDYRIIYDIIDDKLIVHIIAIGHRKHIYD